MDLNKTFSWKSAIIFLVALILCFVAMFVAPASPWVGYPIFIIGYAGLIWNMLVNFKAQHSTGIKAALLIPKIFFAVIILGVMVLIMFLQSL